MVKKLTTEKKDEINGEVICKTRKQFERAGFTVPRIAKELAGIAFADITDFVDIDEAGIVRARPVDEWPDGKGRLVKKIREKRVIRTEKGTKDKPDGDQILDATFEFEMHDKLDAIGKAIAVIGIQKPTKVVFPDENGQPQNIGGLFTNMELATRMAFILKEAAKRKKADAKRSGKN
jgi:hypothetical protein